MYSSHDKDSGLVPSCLSFWLADWWHSRSLLSWHMLGQGLIWVLFCDWNCSGSKFVGFLISVHDCVISGHKITSYSKPCCLLPLAWSDFSELLLPLIDAMLDLWVLHGEIKDLRWRFISSLKVLSCCLVALLFQLALCVLSKHLPVWPLMLVLVTLARFRQMHAQDGNSKKIQCQPGLKYHKQGNQRKCKTRQQRKQNKVIHSQTWVNWTAAIVYTLS